MSTSTNIWACTKKKSISVLEKLVLYAAYVIDTFAALVIGANVAMFSAIIVWDTTYPFITAIIAALSNVIGFVISLLLSIPWYVYAGVAVVAAIPVYSFLWCIAKELTEEEKENCGLSVECSIIVSAACGIGYDICWAFTHFDVMYVNDSSTHMLLIPLLVWSVGTVVLVFGSYAIDLYLHYRKRIKEASQ